MGSRGASANSGKAGAVSLSAADRVASRAVDKFLADNDYMASDGEINGVYEDAFVREAMKTGASNLEINNALNKALRSNDVDYMGARARETKLSNNAKPSKREPKALEVNAIEKWNVKGKWTDYKKTLQTKFAKKYPTYEIKIKQSTGRGSSGAGLIDYIVYGVKK